MREVAFLAIAAGLAFVSAAQDQYVRVTFRKCAGSMLQLSELAVYTGTPGNYTRVNVGLTTTTKTDETKLDYGEYLFVRNGTTSSLAGTGGEGSISLFDNNTSKMCRQGLSFLAESDSATNPDKWAVLTMKLPEGTETPTAYNFKSANDGINDRCPTHWTVEMSHDGVHFYEFDKRDAAPHPSASYTWYNGGEATPYAFTQPLVVFAPIPSQRLDPAGCRPGVTITDFVDEVTLDEGRDYTLAYENNTSAGTATVIVTGVPGTAYDQLSRTRTFEIFPVTMRVTVQTPAELGAPLSLTVVDPVGDVELEEGVHYAYTATGLDRCGSAAVIVRGVEGTLYEGVAVTNVFTVAKSGQLTGVTVNSESDFIVAEMPVTAFGRAEGLPEPEVRTVTGEPLEKDVDYTLSYSGADKVGFATVTVTGLAPHTGAQTLKFYLADACNAGLIGAGTDTNQYVRITFRQAGASSPSLLELSELAVYAPNAGGGLARVNLNLATKTTTSVSTLTPGSYIYVRNPGSPTTIAGTGGETSDKLFDGSKGTKLCGTSPGSASKDTPANWLQLTMLLPAGTARPIAYNFCSGNDAKSGGRLPTYWTVELSHDGEFFGVVDEQLPGTNPGANSTWFNGGGTGAADANPYPFAKRAIKMEPIPNQRAAPGGCTPALTLVDIDNGRELAKDEDYTVEYRDNLSAGTATVVVTGAEGGLYEGFTRTATFHIFDPSWTVSAADVDLGKEGPAVPSIAIVDPYDGRTLSEGVEYTASFAGLDRSGTAAVIVRGVAGTIYRNVVTTNFFLVRRPGRAARVAISAPSDFIVAELPDIVFRGEAVEPKPVVRSASGELLEENVHYALAYGGCDSLGPATVTVTGLAPHAGTQVVSFNLTGVWLVTPAATGGGSGAAWNSAMTLAEAVAAAGANDQIWLKAGVYSNAAVTVNRSLTLRGGLKGDEDPTTEPRGSGLSVLDGCATNGTTGVATVLTVSAPADADIRFERIEVRRARTRGVNISMSRGRVTFDGCRFYDNGYASGQVYGRGVNAAGNGSSTLVFENCEFTENRFRYNTGGLTSIYGQALYLSSVGRTELTGTLFLRNGLIPSTGWRAAEGRSNGHGWCLYAANSPLTVTDCDFVANIGLLHQTPYNDGGVIWLEGNSASSFVSCRFLGNTTTSFEDVSNPKGGATFTLNTTSGSLTTFDLCTFAYNISVGTVGTAYTQINGDARIRNSIFYANAVRHPSVGCADIYVHGGACTVENCRLSADGASSYRCATGATLVLPAAIETRDPLFALSEEEFLATYVKGGQLTGTDAYQPWNDAAMDLYGRLDCHLRSEAGRWTGADWTTDDVSSPFIDGATEGTPYANETEPNGGAANLGGYGNTAEASRTPIAVPTLSEVEEDQTNDVGTVLYRVTTGGEGSYLANVYFCRGAANPGGTGTNGWDEVRTAARGVSRDLPLEIPLGEYVEKGTSWHWRIVIVAKGGTALVDGQTTAQYDLSPYKVSGGPANVIHVWGDAGGKGDGSTWWNAFRTLKEAVAVIPDAKTEIWIAGSNVVDAAASATFVSAMKIRGGFTGLENSPDDRAEGAVSVIDGAGACDLFVFSNTAEVEIERMRFLRGKARGLKRSASAGDLKLVGCDFSFNGANGFCDYNTAGGSYFSSNRALGGAGASLYGQSGSKLTITNCTFAGNRQQGNDYPGSGVGAFVGGFAAATISDSLFLTNSCSGKETQATALQIYNTKARVERCEFRGNYDSGKTGKTVAVHDSCGGTVFANCAFVGNTINSESATWGNSYPGGIVVVRTSAAAQTVAFTNCTFAYNYAALDATLCIAQGAVTVADSIFHRNLVHSSAAFRAVHIVLTQSGATCMVAYSNFDSASSDYVTSQYGDGSVVTTNCVAGVDPAFVTGTADFETITGADPVQLPKGPSLSGLFPSALAAFDCHLLSTEGYFDNAGTPLTSADTTSPCIDAGDPDDLRWGLEPGHNGMRLNLGAYGGTAKASQTPYVEPKVNNDITCTFDSEWSQPTVHFTLGGVGNYSATVVIKVSTNGSDWCYTSEPLTGRRNGDRVDYRVARYFVPGQDQLVFRIEIESLGTGSATVSGSFDVVGKLPPWNGKGGPKNVIHVFDRAIGKGDGTSWTDAVPTLREAIALRSAERNEIWVVGSNAVSAVMGPYTIATPLKIRGGFTATENAASERPAGTTSVLDGQDACDILVFSNTAEVEIERMRFLRAKNRGLKRSASAGDLRLVGCDFSFNGAKGNCDYNTGGGGYYISNRALGGAGASLYGQSGSKLTITNCTFTGNRQPNNSYPGSGIGAFVGGFAEATISDSLFLTNSCSGSETQATALQIYNTRARVERCEFRGNYDSGRTGKTVAVHDACGGTVFANCAFVGNAISSDSASWGNDYPGGIVVVRTSVAAQTVAFTNCTFAYNFAARDATLCIAKGAVTVADSIFHRNLVHASAIFRAAHVVLTQSDATCTVSHSNFDSSDSEHVTSQYGDAIVVTTNCVSGLDPAFVTGTADFEALSGANPANRPRGPSLSGLFPSALAAFDCHLLSTEGYFDNAGTPLTSADTTSPCIDAGDPDDLRWGLEPGHNGMRLNLGAYGGTAKASQTPYVEPKVNDDITCTFESEWSQPTVHFSLGGAGSYTATVIIKVSTNGTDWCYTSEPLAGKRNGDRVDYRVARYFVPGQDQLVFRIEIESLGTGSATESESFDVVGKLPPWSGKGGPKNVIHVFDQAMGRGDGTSWTDAVPTLREAIALRSAERNEIWVVGSNALSAVMGPYAIATPLTIRGGFTATENAASERPADEYSTFDGEDAVSIITFSNTARVEFERIRFLRGANYGVSKSASSGDLVLTDCRFERCGSKSDGGRTGNGCWQVFTYGEGAATLRASGSARLWISNCVFAANRTTSTNLGGGGVGAYISGFARATIDGADFVGNRCNISGEGQAAALQLESQPATVRNCQFRGNANAAWSGKIVGVFNASGSTVFTNCLFVGNRLNSDLTQRLGTTASANQYPAPVVAVRLNSAGATCHFENCTFADNSTCKEATLGVGVGKVTVRNSIFHRNVRNTANYMGVDGWVGSGSASLEFAWTMFDGDGTEHFGAWAENRPPVATNSCLIGYDPNFVSKTAAFDALIGTTNLSAAAFSEATLSAVRDFNVHLRGGNFRDERTGLVRYCPGRSPAIDRGDPSADWRREPEYNGRRINLGAYGNTPWATTTPDGTMLKIR